jgi:hypothetical protein
MNTILIALVVLIATVTANADDRRTRRQDRREPNWIIERQRGYQVEGVPTDRLIIGRREIDIYRDGTMFEKGNVVGVKH